MRGTLADGGSQFKSFYEIFSTMSADFLTALEGARFVVYKRWLRAKSLHLIK